MRGRVAMLVAVASMLGVGMGVDCMPAPLPPPRARPRERDDEHEQPDDERDTMPAPQPCEDAGDGTCIHDHQASETACALPGGYRPARGARAPVIGRVDFYAGPVVNRSREEHRRVRQLARKRAKDAKE